MPSVDQTNHLSYVALLSAASASDGGATQPDSGEQSVLAHQIAALRSAGVRKFMIEIETVPGALLAMADRLTRAGNSIDFVRSAHDLQSKMAGSDILIVQAEGIYIAPLLLEQLLGQSSPFIVTVDGRGENAPFERIDLNTRWAGLQVLPSSSVAKIGELPEGWNIASSLLRQALQDRVPQRQLQQSHLQKGDLRRAEVAADVKKLSSDVIARRAGQQPGLIEATVFAPAASWLAAKLWPVRARTMISDGGSLILASSSTALASFGFTKGAAVAALTAMLANAIRQALGTAEQSQREFDFVGALLWLLLAGALMAGGASDPDWAGEGLFAGIMVVGMSLLARQLRLPAWGRKILQSPALIALTILLATFVGDVASVSKWVAAAQLALLVIAKWDHGTSAGKL